MKGMIEMALQDIFTGTADTPRTQKGLNPLTVIAVALVVIAVVMVWQIVILPAGQATKRGAEMMTEGAAELEAGRQQKVVEDQHTQEALAAVRSDATLKRQIDQSIEHGVTKGRGRFYAIEESSVKSGEFLYNSDAYEAYLEHEGVRKTVVHESPEGEKTILFVVQVDWTSPNGTKPNLRMIILGQ